MMEMPFFAAFMIFIILWYDGEGEASPLLRSLYGCLLQLSPCSASGWPLILLEIKRIRYYLKAPYPEKRRKEGRKEKEKCVHEISTERNACSTERIFVVLVVIIPGLGRLPILHVGLPLSQLEHLQTWRCVFFFFFFPSLRHEVAVPRIPTCGPLNLACEKCGAQVRNRNETQVITPSDTTPGGGRRL